MNTTHTAGQDRAILPPLADGASEEVYTGRAPAPTGRVGKATEPPGKSRAKPLYQMAHPERRALTQPNCPPRSSPP